MKLEIIKIKTRKILPPKDDIYPVLFKYLPKLLNSDVLFISSKVLAIHQGRCVKIDPKIDKDELIVKESENYIPRKMVPGQYAVLTIKEKILGASAGIDESNGNGYYVLLPKKPRLLAKEIWKILKKKYNLKKFAVIITDSHTFPLRRGVTGISVGFFGLDPIKDLIGREDVFGRKLKITQVNIVDSLAAMAVLFMGEGKEQTPFVICRGTKSVKFTNRNLNRKISFPEKTDLYAPLLKVFRHKP